MKLLTDNEIKANISANLRRLLDLRGWAQSDLARESDVKEMMISLVVRGISLPGISIAARIADALETSIDKLIAPPPEKKSRRSA